MINVFKILPPSVRYGFRLPQQCHKTLSNTKYYKVLQSITKYYKALQSITKYFKVLQSITKTNLAHLLEPIFGLVTFIDQGFRKDCSSLIRIVVKDTSNSQDAKLDTDFITEMKFLQDSGLQK